jgi:DNA-binding MarR family transcriptional regulator
METLFTTASIRSRPPRGQPLLAILGRGWWEPWPPPSRDPNDVALAATRLLATAGRMQTRLRRVARRYGVDPRVFRFLLLFAERKAPLRVTDVAENMGVSHQTASRIVTLALEAGLVDLLNSHAIDGRAVDVRLTVAGRDATVRCLDALRDDATKIGTTPSPPHRGWSGAYGVRHHLRYGGPMDEGWIRYDPP